MANRGELERDRPVSNGAGINALASLQSVDWVL